MKSKEERQRHGDSAIPGALEYYASKVTIENTHTRRRPLALRRVDEIGPDDDDEDDFRGRGWDVLAGKLRWDSLKGAR